MFHLQKKMILNETLSNNILENSENAKVVNVVNYRFRTLQGGAVEVFFFWSKNYVVTRVENRRASHEAKIETGP